MSGPARRVLSSLTIAALVGGCLSGRPTRPQAAALGVQPREEPRTVGSIPAPSADGRLPALAVPSRYDLRLRVDPARSIFSGQVTIGLTVRARTSYIVLHARDLEIRSVTLHARGRDVRGQLHEPRSGRPNDEIVLGFPIELPVGAVDLEIHFDSAFSEVPRGLYRVRTDGSWYAFTDLEPTAARTVFPCFDEPAYKAPFTVTVTAPEGLTVLSNMPEDEAEPGEQGIVHRFTPTPPLPTYLVALAVGAFDLEQAPAGPLPIRLVRPHGATGDAQWPLGIAKDLARVLEDYVGEALRFPKLDLVAVPLFRHAAMENPGLITVKQSILLPGKDRAGTIERRLLTVVIAHELAHQWFGDVVTPNGWEDLWLSEGLATFLAARAVDAYNPLFGARLDQVASIQAMMDDDTTAVRRAVTTPQEAERAFTRLPFEKGASILFMLERWLGEAAMRTALRAYLREHAWSSVTTKDLVDALEGASGQSLADMVGPFLDRPGVPIVDSSASCEAGRLSAVTVRQDVWAGQTPWTIPVCVGFPDGGSPRCAAIDDVPVRLAAPPSGASCPAWVDPNPGLAGYYRYVVRPDQLEAAASVAPRMSPEAKLGLLFNAWAAVRNSRLHPDAVLRFLVALDGERSPPVLEQEMAVLLDLDRRVVRAEDRPAFRRWVAQRFEPLRAAVQSSVAREGDDRRARARPLLLEALGTLAHSDDVLQAASDATRRWLAGEPLDPDIGARAVVIGGARADAAMVDGLMARAKSGAPEDRERALEALSRVDDPSLLRRVLLWTLDADGPGEAAGHALVRGMSERPEARPIVFEWIKAPGDRMTAKRTKFSPALAALRFACEDAQRDPLEKLLSVSDGTKYDDVYKREQKEAIACRDFAAAHGASVAAYLKSVKTKTR